MKIVSVADLRKSYGRVKAVNGFTFDVEEGEIYGIIGPDGAGKTTLFRILATLMLPDSGTASVTGLDIRDSFREIRRRIGYMPGRFSLYQDLSVEENLEFFASVFNTSINRNYDMVKGIYCQLEPFRKRRAGKLSGGMKQKLALCCALIHAPRLLLLDEPTTGVDPVSRKEFWDMLQRLRRDYGITVIASTPYMDEASWCDRISLVQDGVLMRTDTPDGIRQAYSGRLYAVRSDDMRRLMGVLKECPSVESSFSFGDSFHVTLMPDATAVTLAESLSRSGMEQVVIREASPSVEDCFMSLMSKSNDKQQHGIDS